MNYLLFLIAGLMLTLLMFTGCSGRKISDVGRCLKSTKKAALNYEKERSVRSLNSMESEGVSLIRKGELDKAVEVYNKIAEMSHYKGRGRMMNGITIMLRDVHDYGDIPRCVDWCSEYVKTHEGEINIETAKNMATLYGKSNRFREAVEILKPYFDHSDADVDFYHDYSTFNLDIAEHHRLKGREKEKCLSRAKKAVEIMGDRWGKNQRYYVALGEYYTVARDFTKSLEAYRTVLGHKKTGDSGDEFYIQFSEANLLCLELSLLSGNTERGLEYVDRIMDSYKKIDPFSYDRFYVDRLFALMFSEYYLNSRSIESRHVFKLIDEHKRMSDKGMQQPRQLKVIYTEIHNYLVSREKGDHQQCAKSLKRAIAYFKVTQDCPTYRPVHIPAAVSMLYGLQAESLIETGEVEKARKAYEKSLEYNPDNRRAMDGLKKIGERTNNNTST